ncbi:Uncharacterized protein OBRU01_03247 [Operophtera brumata]|uniref:Uncharacterized protein n=1 Tax=Operophtera brumata TaxID=104452 RepID=A0A0L7LM46_OPEBR|nr:Uncharacterized protein OBRU01_03247 [Operophtera brumata]
MIVSDIMWIFVYKINKNGYRHTVPEAVKIATESKLQLCGGWGGQGYALEGCVDNGLLRPPPPHSSQLGTVYATKRRRRNGKR